MIIGWCIFTNSWSMGLFFHPLVCLLTDYPGILCDTWIRRCLCLVFFACGRRACAGLPMPNFACACLCFSDVSVLSGVEHGWCDFLRWYIFALMAVCMLSVSTPSCGRVRNMTIWRTKNSSLYFPLFIWCRHGTDALLIIIRNSSNGHIFTLPLRFVFLRVIFLSRGIYSSSNMRWWRIDIINK